MWSLKSLFNEKHISLNTELFNAELKYELFPL